MGCTCMTSPPPQASLEEWWLVLILFSKTGKSTHLTSHKPFAYVVLHSPPHNTHPASTPSPLHPPHLPLFTLHTLPLSPSTPSPLHPPHPPLFTLHTLPSSPFTPSPLYPHLFTSTPSPLHPSHPSLFTLTSSPSTPSPLHPSHPPLFTLTSSPSTPSPLHPYLTSIQP